MLDYGKKCVVIDLDETLVHSSFKVNQHQQLMIFVIWSQLYWKRRNREAESMWSLAYNLTVHQEIPVIVAY